MIAGKIKDEHEKDALASAIKAFNTYSKVFERTENLLSSMGFSKFYEKIIDSVISGEAGNINEAINKLLVDYKKKQGIPRMGKVEEKKFSNKIIDELKERIKGLEKDIVILKGYSQNLKNKVKESEDRLENYRKEVSEKKRC